MRLTKHHGLANDFLVYVDLDGAQPNTADLAIALCDRHRGIGADGLIQITAGRDGAALSMDLRNSDGSPAEMSGNGMRCLVQAAVMADVAPGHDFEVATSGGVRAVSYGLTERLGVSWVAVDMGPTSPGTVDPSSLRHSTPHHRAATVDIGNPHLVLQVDDAESVEAAAHGPGYEAQFANGANIHWVAATPDGRLRMTIWERGAGVTQACGTGACAAATAANSWGLVAETVGVDMPGGSVEVTLGDTVTLAGPAAYIGAVDVDLDWILV